MFRRFVLPWLVWVFYRLLTWSWRVEFVEAPEMRRAFDNKDTLIFTHWHGDELSLVSLVARYRIATMTSTSKDGQLIDFVIRRLGGVTSKGSSTRGGIGALKGLIRLLRTGYNASMAVDGPKGPIFKAKPGAFELSRLAHAKIVPTGAAVKNGITFHKSWNKAKLPKPFSRIVFYFAEPWPPLSHEVSPKDPGLAARLESEIAKACQRAHELLR